LLSDSFIIENDIAGRKIMDVQEFADLEAEFVARVSKMVWCNLATQDTQNRPRSRIVHPVWEGTAGWIITRRTSHKAKHLAHNPFVSIAYISDIAKPVYVDCSTAWVDDKIEQQRVWDFILNTPEPYGYNPAISTMFKTIEDANFGLLKLTPWRIEVVSFGTPTQVWRAQA
jgi:general stress protein 26